MDGGDIGELEFENFNAASGKVEVTGVSVHPGYAKDKMVNAIRVAADFISSLPADEVPERTDGYEGFFHVVGIEGGVERATVSYIIRDHDRQRFEQRKQLFLDTAARLNEKYGADTLVATVKDQYYNMREQIDPVMHVIDIAKQAMEEADVKPRVQAIRGGTDGAQLSFKGLPCPNIFAGGLNFHGPHEFLPIPNMKKAMQVVVNICRLVAEREA